MPETQLLLKAIGLQTSQIANRTAIYALGPKARNRLNPFYMVFVFTDQLIGSAVSNKLYTQSDWVTSGRASVASSCVARRMLCQWSLESGLEWLEKSLGL